MRSPVDEITDFLVTSPTPEQIIAFQTSEAVNQRLHDLLDKSQNEELTSEERKELTRFLEVGYMTAMLKAKAWLKLKQKATNQ
jgi:hypothetical protein